MQKTHLSIDYSNNLSTKVLRIFDTSHYCEAEKVENFLLEVLPPNSMKWATFHVDKKFSIGLNSSNLHYHTVSDSKDLINLPDGIYELKISIKPNSFTIKHFYHFRITSLLTSLKKERTRLLQDQCKLSRQEFRSNRDKLREIEEFMEAAKYMVEENGQKLKGKELYQWAEELLKQYTNDCKC